MVMDLRPARDRQQNRKWAGRAGEGEEYKLMILHLILKDKWNDSTFIKSFGEKNKTISRTQRPKI